MKRIISIMLSIILSISIMLNLVPICAYAQEEQNYNLTISSNLDAAKFSCTVRDYKTLEQEIIGSGTISLTKNDIFIRIKNNEIEYDKENYRLDGWMITIGDKSIGPVSEANCSDIMEKLEGNYTFNDEEKNSISNQIVAWYLISLDGKVTNDIHIEAVFSSLKNHTLTVKSSTLGTGFKYTPKSKTYTDLQKVDEQGIFNMELSKENILDFYIDKDTFSFEDSQTFLGWRISIGGERIGPTKSALYDKLNTELNGAFQSLDDASSFINTIDSFPLSLYGTVNDDVLIEAVFEDSNSPQYIPKVTVAKGDSEKGNITFKSLVHNINTETDAIWTLRPNLDKGYCLAYIQVDDDISTRVNSENGTTIRWNVKSNMNYRAHFEKAKVFLGDTLSYAPTIFENAKLNTFSQIQPKSIFSGQRVMFVFKYTLPCFMPEGTSYDYKLYSGENTSGKLLASHSQIYRGWLHPNDYEQTLIVDSMPGDVKKVTFTFQINDGEIVTNTYDVLVNQSGNMELSYLTTPNDKLEEVKAYPTDVRTADQGPNIYDAITFTDENTGKLSMYFAASGGVMKYNPESICDLEFMKGMLFRYRDNDSTAGYAFGIGGKDENSLAALVKEQSGSYSQGLKTTYCIYECVNEVWSKVENSNIDNSKTHTEYAHGLVLSKDNVWVNEQHWDGKIWTPNEVIFNSFWKDDKSDSYAGSKNGIYKYYGGKWEHVDGTTGPMGITSAYRNCDDGITFVTCSEYRAELRNTSLGMRGELKKVIVSGSSVSVTDIASVKEIQDQISPQSGENIYVGIDKDGIVYAMSEGKWYIKEGSSGYIGSNVYKHVDGKWQNQTVDGFNAPDEGTDPSSKVRPDGVSYILNPCKNVSLFLGAAGAIYAKYGETTIKFEENEGSKVNDNTQLIGTRITPPDEPTMENYDFSGWYTKQNCLKKYLYKFNVMPAKDITLYAKWVKSGNVNFLDGPRKMALNSLDIEYKKYIEKNYDIDAWGKLNKAYANSKENINSAISYDIIQSSLKNGLSAMSDIKKSTTVTVAVTIEKLSVDGKFIVEPILITTDKYSKASVVVTDLLKQHYKESYKERPYRMTGSEANAFYLSSIYVPNYDPSALGSEFSQSYKGFLSEFDGGYQSGWMYCVNNSFPGVGASAWTLNNGDVMRWQFTCKGLGSDIGADNSAWGSSESTVVANKDVLVWKVAEINGMTDKANWLSMGNNQSNYNTAMAILQNIISTQVEVDDIVAKLGGKVDTAEEKLAKDKITAIKNLTKYVQAGDYRMEEQVLLEQYISEGTLNINAAKDNNAIKLASDNAKNIINTLKTNNEYTAEENVVDTDIDKVYKKTGEYLVGLGTPNIGYVGGEWLVIDLARSSHPVPSNWAEDYYNNAVTYINKNINAKGQLHPVKSTDNSRLILALTALGKDPRNVAGKNLLTPLADLNYLKRQGINGPIWALIALDTRKFEIPTLSGTGTQVTRDNLIAEILGAQLADGGWTLSGNNADPDMTGMAIQALAPYYNSNNKVKLAVNSGITKLSNIQNDLGGYASWGTVNSESCAQVIVALTSLGINPETDPRFIKNGHTLLQALSAFAVEDGFKHTLSGERNDMATEQAYYALTSYYRLINKQTRLYDMTDIEVIVSDSDLAKSVELLIEAIGTVSLDSKDAIGAARASYDALTKGQKSMIKNYEVLTSAEAKYNLLEEKSNEEPKEEEPKNEEPKNEEPKNEEPKKENPKTGDMDTPISWAYASLLYTLAILALISRKKRILKK